MKIFQSSPLPDVRAGQVLKGFVRESLAGRAKLHNEARDGFLGDAGNSDGGPDAVAFYEASQHPATVAIGKAIHTLLLFSTIRAKAEFHGADKMRPALLAFAMLGMRGKLGRKRASVKRINRGRIAGLAGFPPIAHAGNYVVQIPLNGFLRVGVIERLRAILLPFWQQFLHGPLHVKDCAREISPFDVLTRSNQIVFDRTEFDAVDFVGFMGEVRFCLLPLLFYRTIWDDNGFWGGRPRPAQKLSRPFLGDVAVVVKEGGISRFAYLASVGGLSIANSGGFVADNANNLLVVARVELAGRNAGFHFTLTISSQPETASPVPVSLMISTFIVPIIPKENEKCSK